jgi:ABC-type anion transport system duplicated permease subunit
MNPGPSEEVGQTARSVVDALKTQPLVLVLLLINVIFVLFLWFAIREQAQRKDSLIVDLTRLLAACPSAVQIPKTN